MTETVTLHMYDLSQGFAKQLSQSLMNKQFDAVYHTGVVVYNTEYFYGSGIQSGIPAQTPYGSPIERRVLGTTNKSISDIYEWIHQNASQFSEASYNPMTHNCNHFSSSFCAFLGLENFPQEVLRQPDEFLSTNIGSLVKGLFGVEPQTGASSAGKQETQVEAANEQYSSIYIEYPKVYNQEDEVLLTQFSLVSSDSDKLNKILAAFNEQRDIREKVSFTAIAPTEALFDVLALIASTSSIEEVDKVLYPYNYIKQIDSQPTGVQESFLRYLNNFAAELIGMKDVREKHAMYLQYVKKCCENHKLLLPALRCMFTISRLITAKIERIEGLTTFLVVQYNKVESLSSKTDKQCANLICGAVGRLLLTLSVQDSKSANRLRVRIQKIFGGLGFSKQKAPCMKDLAVYLKLDGDEEEFF